MKKVLLLIISIVLLQHCYGQFSVDANVGIGKVNRKIPHGYQEGLYHGLVNLNTHYKFDSIPLEVNISGSLFSGQHYEQHLYTKNTSGFYSHPFMITGGVGFSPEIFNFLEFYGNLNIGYSQVNRSNTLNEVYDGNSTWENHKKTLQQMALVIRVGLRLGKNHVRGIIGFNNYFLYSFNRYNLFGDGHGFNFIIGISYRFD